MFMLTNVLPLAIAMMGVYALAVVADELKAIRKMMEKDRGKETD